MRGRVGLRRRRLGGLRSGRDRGGSGIECVRAGISAARLQLTRDIVKMAKARSGKKGERTNGLDSYDHILPYTEPIQTGSES